MVSYDFQSRSSKYNLKHQQLSKRPFTGLHRALRLLLLLPAGVFWRREGRRGPERFLRCS